MHPSRIIIACALAALLAGCASSEEWKGQARTDEPMATGSSLPRRKTDVKVVPPEELEKTRGVIGTSAKPR